MPTSSDILARWQKRELPCGKGRLCPMQAPTFTVYTDAHDLFLCAILDQRPDLFSVVGVDCENWEEAMDGLCVMSNVNDGADLSCNTTSHPHESIDEVLAFAGLWCHLKGWEHDVCVLKI